MTLVKTKNRMRLFPWNSSPLQNFLGYDDFFNDDFFAEDSLLPAMNVKENEENFEIEFAAPGFSKEDFDVSIDRNLLNVSGEKKFENEEENENYSRKEFNYNSFKRSLKLPDNINLDSEVKAIYKNGILSLNLLKKTATEEEDKKQIKIE